jgi:hypothetical protein
MKRGHQTPPRFSIPGGGGVNGNEGVDGITVSDMLGPAGTGARAIGMFLRAAGSFGLGRD